MLPLFNFIINHTSPPKIYTLSLHDALPIYDFYFVCPLAHLKKLSGELCAGPRSEEHTSELQSHVNLVCRLLLEKKKNNGSAPFISNHFRSLPAGAVGCCGDRWRDLWSGQKS